MTNEDPNTAILGLERKLKKLTSAFVALGGTLLFILAVTDMQVALIIPEFERIFSEMLGDKPLPLLTQTVIDTKSLGGGLLLPVVIAVVPVGVLIVLITRRTSPLAWAVTVATIFFQGFGAVIALISLYLPLLSIISELNNV